MPDEGACTAILIHGAWQGSWVWDRFTPYLAAAAIPFVAVDLPGNGQDGRAPQDVRYQDYLDQLDHVITSQNGPVVMVGHSGGGIFASIGAERHAERVKGVVYVAGMLLPGGVSYGELLRKSMGETQAGQIGVVPHLRWSADGAVSWVDPEAAQRIFLSDCPALLAKQLACRLTGQPEAGRRIAPYTTPQRFGRIPRLYVEAEGDRSIPLSMQRRMQDLAPGTHRETLTTGHVPQASRPDLLAEAVIPFILAASVSQPQFEYAS